jgi:cytochrome c-type biogenesis protein
LEFSLPLVFGAGVLSFLSPCVLPMVPPYLTYMSGASFEEFRDGVAARTLPSGRLVLTSLFFILGFSLVFVTLGATATAFGQMFRQALPILTPLAGVVIIAMGLHFLGVFRIGFLDRQVRMAGPRVASGPGGRLRAGAGLRHRLDAVHRADPGGDPAGGGEPQTAYEGAALLGLYSAGLGLPFLLSGLAVGPFLSFFASFRRHLQTVERVVGVLLILTGVLFVTGNFTRISFWMLETFPVLSRFG